MFGDVAGRDGELRDTGSLGEGFFSKALDKIESTIQAVELRDRFLLPFLRSLGLVTLEPLLSIPPLDSAPWRAEPESVLIGLLCQNRR